MDRIRKQLDRDVRYRNDNNESTPRNDRNYPYEGNDFRRREERDVEAELRYRNRFNADQYQGRNGEYSRARDNDRYPGRGNESNPGRDNDRYPGRSNEYTSGRENDRYPGRNNEYTSGRDDDRYQGRNRNNEGESYDSTLRNYHPRGGRRIEASKPEDLEWQSNSYSNRKNISHDRDYNHEARNYNREDDYRWNNQEPRNYSRYHRDDRGYRGDYDTDFFWQT